LQTEALSRKEEERQIFERLAMLAGVDVVPGSIRQERPPAHDIECEAVGDGPWAVELVALDAPHTRTRLQNMHTTNEAWDRAFALRSRMEQEALKSRCGDMCISTHFDEAARARDRTRLMRLIQDRLLSLPVGFSGELFSDIDALAEVDWARAGRDSVKDGPHIVASSAGYGLPPQHATICEKLIEKTYRTGAPLELFVYSRHDEVDGHRSNGYRTMVAVTGLMK
jgi:hypothetical protein